MRVVIHGRRPEVRRPLSFTISASIHGSILAWLVLSPIPPPAPRLSVYDREIRPYEKHLVWYHLSDRLPAIAPDGDRNDPRPPRAAVKSPQPIVAGATDDGHSRRTIFAPAPEIELPKPEPLPNVVAVNRPPPRLFNPPVERPARPPLPRLPQEPRVERRPEDAAPPLANAPRPEPREFQHPPEVAVKLRQQQLPDAPDVQRTAQSAALPLAGVPRPQPRDFKPPPETAPQVRRQALPEAPDVERKAQAAALPLNGRVEAPPREFTPPPERGAPRIAAAALPDAPAANRGPRPASLPGAFAADPRAPLRPFTPPQQPAAREPAPALSPAPAPDRAPAVEATLAIAGLDPARTTNLPKPPGSRPGSFSAGPDPRPAGGDANPGAAIVVPGLLARGPAGDPRPTLVPGPPPPRPSEQVLVAAARRALESPVLPAPLRAAPPDPRLRGRAVYTLAIQMPNVTSYSGSWTVWFAEKAAGGPSRIQPPVPLRKVDPKYIAAAAAERVEGTVRLYGVIRTDGRIDAVELLRHLDDRLDRSAEEALVKWEFTPATRDGRPVEVEAVFEIPFRLAPRPAK